MKKQLNLYLVKLRGMQYNSTGTAYGINYAIATDSNTAYQIVKNYLDKRAIGFSSDRVLESVTLLAERTPCPGCKTILYTPDFNKIYP